MRRKKKKSEKDVLAQKNIAMEVWWWLLLIFVFLFVLFVGYWTFRLARTEKFLFIYFISFYLFTFSVLLENSSSERYKRDLHSESPCQTSIYLFFFSL
jgi:hypothetical protein